MLSTSMYYRILTGLKILQNAAQSSGAEAQRAERGLEHALTFSLVSRADSLTGGSLILFASGSTLLGPPSMTVGLLQGYRRVESLFVVIDSLLR